ARCFQLLKILDKHEGTINSIRFSSDGQRVVSSSHDQTIRIWNIASGQQLQTDKTIRLWDVELGKELMRLEGHSGWIWSVCFSSDGKNIASCSTDETIRIWDVNSGKEIQQLIGHLNTVLCVQFSPDDKMIVSSSSDNTIGIWGIKKKYIIDINYSFLILQPTTKKNILLNSPINICKSNIFFNDLHVLENLKCIWCNKNVENHEKIIIFLKYIYDRCYSNDCLYWPRKSIFFLYVFLLNQLEEEIQVIIQCWVRILNLKLGWIQDFDKIVIKYVNIDYSTFDDTQLLCSGSRDSTVRVWDIETNKQIKLFKGHSSYVFCVKFSQYYYCNDYRNVICSSSNDKTIRFWDIKDDQQLKIFNGHTGGVGGIEFSPFSGGRYLCSGSTDKTIRLWDVEASKLLHIFNGHYLGIVCVDISPLQSYNNKSNRIGVIGGNGYTICSGSVDGTVCIWDIETARRLTVFKKHEFLINSVKYGSNELVNTILSGSNDKSARLWDIRSDKQIQVFNGHTDDVNAVEYSPFVVKNIEIGDSSNVICSGSLDNTIRFWDIRSNKNELYTIKGNGKDNGILCLKFLQLKKENRNNNRDYSVKLCYGLREGSIRIWG
ncbi:hypothetical protein RFI_11513, partial [Reticulomyxa filosa]